MGDVKDPFARARKNGWQKIERFCKQTLANGFNHIWIDTCCIDKTNSAELSESINSMFIWYKAAEICYAYLDDCQDLSGLGTSEWFTRAWTLQELIAPKNLLFFNESSMELGSRELIASEVAKASKVPSQLLKDPTCLSSFSVAARMRWAADRRATRAEDKAYSLLGIFDVNISLLYGEGGQRAFRRLQEEIVRTSSTDSIFAWSNVHEPDNFGLLAWSPEAFRSSPVIEETRTVSRPARNVTMLHGYVSTSFELASLGYHDTYIARLNCERSDRTKLVTNNYQFPFHQDPFARGFLTRPFYIVLKRELDHSWVRIGEEEHPIFIEVILKTIVEANWRVTHVTVRQWLRERRMPAVHYSRMERAALYGYDFSALIRDYTRRPVREFLPEESKCCDTGGIAALKHNLHRLVYLQGSRHSTHTMVWFAPSAKYHWSHQTYWPAI